MKIVIGLALVAAAMTVFVWLGVRWWHCSESGGRFMRGPFSFWECVR